MDWGSICNGGTEPRRGPSAGGWVLCAGRILHNRATLYISVSKSVNEARILIKSYIGAYSYMTLIGFKKSMYNHEMDPLYIILKLNGRVYLFILIRQRFHKVVMLF